MFSSTALSCLPAMAAPAQRSRIYDESAEGAKQIDAALLIAKSTGKHVLLQFGGNWCIWCIKLHALFETNKMISDTLKDNYVVTLVDYNDRNKHLASKYGAQELGLPFIVVLDAEGKHLITKNTEQLEERDHHSVEKVLAFLNEWTRLAYASRQAALKNKSVAQSVREFVFEKADAESPAITAHAREALPYLIDAVKNRPGDMSAEAHAQARVRAYEAIASLGPTTGVSFLAEQLVADSQLRDRLRATLARLGPMAKEAIPVLTNAFHRSDLDLRFRAAWALAHIEPSNPELVPSMIGWLKDSNVVCRRFATTVLEDLGPAAKPALTTLKAALDDPDETVRQRATNALARLKARQEPP